MEADEQRKQRLAEIDEHWKSIEGDWIADEEDDVARDDDSDVMEWLDGKWNPAPFGNVNTGTPDGRVTVSGYSGSEATKYLSRRWVAEQLAQRRGR